MTLVNLQESHELEFDQWSQYDLGSSACSKPGRQGDRCRSWLMVEAIRGDRSRLVWGTSWDEWRGSSVSLVGLAFLVSAER